MYESLNHEHAGAKSFAYFQPNGVDVRSLAEGSSWAARSWQSREAAGGEQSQRLYHGDKKLN